MNETTLASLTHAVADYESAWRRSCAADLPTERTAATEAMNVAYRAQAAALKSLGEEVGPTTALTIEAALIMASARTHGERPAMHIGHRTPADVFSFIHRHVRDGA